MPGVGPDLLPAAPGQLGVPTNGRERCPQLVTGVRDELPYARLALLPRVQGAVDVVEHPVERGSDLPDLGVRVGLGGRHPLVEGHFTGVQGQLGDPGRGGGDLAQRPQGDPDEDGAAMPAAMRPAPVTLSSTTMRVLRVLVTESVGRAT